MSTPARLASLLLAMFLTLVAAAPSAAKDADATRAQIREQSQAALERLYAAEPAARAAIAASAGYATFSTIGLKIGAGGTGNGRGIAVALPGKAETFMRFVEVQAGLGLGIKRHDLVFVFESPQALARFLDKGWEYGGQVTVAAKAGDGGRSFQGAVSVSDGVWLYQLTQAGLSAELTLKGSRYFKDKKLN